MYPRNFIPNIPSYLYRYVLAASSTFFISVLLGYSSAVTQTEEITKLFDEVVKEYASLRDVGPVTLFLFIFLNNTLKTYTVMFLGIFFGIAPVLFLIANGYILGVVSYMITHQESISMLLLGILPHGIIEIPALILGSSYGIWLGGKLYRKIYYQEPMREHMRTASNIFVRYLIPFFFVAAFIEAFITSYLLSIAR